MIMISIYIYIYIWYNTDTTLLPQNLLGHICNSDKAEVADAVAPPAGDAGSGVSETGNWAAYNIYSI